MNELVDAIKYDTPRYNVHGVEVPRTYYFEIDKKIIEVRINDQSN